MNTSVFDFIYYFFAIYDAYDFPNFCLKHLINSDKLHLVKYLNLAAYSSLSLVLFWSIFNFSIFGIFPVISLLLVSHLILFCNGSRNRNIAVLYCFYFLLIWCILWLRMLCISQILFVTLRTISSMLLSEVFCSCQSHPVDWWHCWFQLVSLAIFFVWRICPFLMGGFLYLYYNYGSIYFFL